MKSKPKLRMMWAWPSHLADRAGPIWVSKEKMVSSTQKPVRVAVIPRGEHKALIARIACKMWPASERREGRYTVHEVLDCLGVIEKRKARK